MYEYIVRFRDVCRFEIYMRFRRAHIEIACAHMNVWCDDSHRMETCEQRYETCAVMPAGLP